MFCEFEKIAPTALLVSFLLFLAGVVRITHIIAFWLFLFLLFFSCFLFFSTFLTLQIDRNLTFTQVFHLRYAFLLEKIGFFHVFHFEMSERSYFFVFGYAFVVGRIEERLKADIKRRTLFGVKNSCL
jgi:hypothetical protein